MFIIDNLAQCHQVFSNLARQGFCILSYIEDLQEAEAEVFTPLYLADCTITRYVLLLDTMDCLGGAMRPRGFAYCMHILDEAVTAWRDRP